MEAKTWDRSVITQSINQRLGQRKCSPPGAQQVTVATVQSDQLTMSIPTQLYKMTLGTGQFYDSNNEDNREEDLLR